MCAGSLHIPIGGPEAAIVQKRWESGGEPHDAAQLPSTHDRVHPAAHAATKVLAPANGKFRHPEAADHMRGIVIRDRTHLRRTPGIHYLANHAAIGFARGSQVD